MQRLKEFIDSISPISETTWLEVAPLFAPEKLEPQEFFVESGRYAQKMAFLESGCVRAFFTNSQGKEYNKQFFVGPSMIGAYTSLLTQTPNRIPQQALTHCKLWVAHYAELERLYAQFHDLETLGRKVAEHYFLEKERKELEMALMDATERYLLFRQTFPTLEQLVPQYQIASYLGISSTQLSRLRAKLKNSS
ncbi:Crp/Fnr family transcriptional regulator [Pontibacter sp. G13]|uniref:Crp/Fnr family transcriptional regulator n=1 Tax=Pontibacter sp. G13 TaxID=3074898 RepID=UPI002889190A|nr:Crp/Fnr family transcriptional regulator [Pontibacter sp. G13]WNJ17491.1 Crp/Fnr family transcriptional regulator [Pontibacter sp. G13]